MIQVRVLCTSFNIVSHNDSLFNFGHYFSFRIFVSLFFSESLVYPCFYSHCSIKSDLCNVCSSPHCRILSLSFFPVGSLDTGRFYRIFFFLFISTKVCTFSTFLRNCHLDMMVFTISVKKSVFFLLWYT